MIAILAPARPEVNPARVLPLLPSIDLDDDGSSVVQAAYVPSVGERFENTGYEIGLSGSLCDVADTFPDASKRDILVHALAFSEGQYNGFRAYARQIGHAVGLNGGSCERPELIPSRFELFFQIGWDKGNREFEERAAILADFFQQLDWEAAWEHEQRDIEAIHRESGGWDRASGLALV